MTDTIESGICVNDLFIIVIMIKFIIENNDNDGQSNGDVMGFRCCCDYYIVVITLSIEITATSKSIDRPKVQQIPNSVEIRNSVYM